MTDQYTAISFVEGKFTGWYDRDGDRVYLIDGDEVPEHEFNAWVEKNPS